MLVNTKHVLLAEDNEADIRLFTHFFEHAAINAKLSLVRDGDEATNFLTKQGEYKNAEDVDLIFLDINLPKVSGFDVLKLIRNNYHLRRMIVIILSGSSLERDMEQAYDLSANCYVQKDKIMAQSDSFFQTIDQFWFQQVSCPSHNLELY